MIGTERKPVVFVDFHGTICHDHYWRSLPEEKQGELAALLFGEDQSLVYDWMRGRHTAEVVNRLVADALALPYDALWTRFVADCQNMTVAPGTLDRLMALRSVANTVLITGNMDSFTRFTVPALELDRYFDVISSSFDEGRLKTEDGGALFRHYADRFSVPIEACTAIDDAADVCALFARLGGTALRVTADRPVDDILDDVLRSLT